MSQFKHQGDIPNDRGINLMNMKKKNATHTTLLADCEGRAVDENTSDGYHTFKELYEFRKVYNATFLNEWFYQGKYLVHKSLKHSDGEDCFGGGWFIVVATLPTGDISNHYEVKDWDLFNCETRDKAKEWDGHTSQDVFDRIKTLSAEIASKYYDKNLRYEH